MSKFIITQDRDSADMLKLLGYNLINNPTKDIFIFENKENPPKEFSAIDNTKYILSNKMFF